MPTLDDCKVTAVLKRLSCALFFVFTVAANPREAAAAVGEMLQQCTEQYGTAAFERRDAELDYRSYILPNKIVRVLYDRDESVIEQVTRRFPNIESLESARTASVSAMLGIQVTLARAYGFTDEQLSDLTHTTRTGPDELTSTSANDAVTVACTLKLDEPDHELTFMAMVALRAALDRGERLQKFFTRSMAEELERGLKR